MDKKTPLWSLVVVLVVAAGLAYLYLYPGARTAPATPLPPPALPDNKVVAGPVAAISAKSITVVKQDGTKATLSMSAATQILTVGAPGKPGTPKVVADIKVGAMVLVTPSQADATVAKSIVLLPAPPAH